MEEPGRESVVVLFNFSRRLRKPPKRWTNYKPSLKNIDGL